MSRRKAAGFIGFLSAGLLVFLAGQVHTLSAARAEPGVHIVRSDEHGLVLDVYAPVYAIETQTPAAIDYQQLKVSGFEVTTEPGKPQLPQWTALIGVPAGAQVEVRVLSDESEPLAGKFNLLPSPSPAPLIDDRQSGTTKILPDARVYASAGLYPVRVAEVTEEAWLREQRVVRVAVSPFQYNPVTGQLVWHRYLQVEVRFDRSSNSSIVRPASNDRPDPFEPVYRQSLLNYEVARAWRGHNSLDASSSIPALSTAATPQYKIVVDHDGLYQITYAALQAAGVPVDTLDPSTFQMTSQGQDVAIEVAAQTPGQFKPGDAITFYGQKFHGAYLAAQYASEGLFYYPYYQTGWIPQFNAAQMEKYTDDNVYWLTFGGAAGARMAAVDGTPGGALTPAVYTATVHAKQFNYYYSYSFTGEDAWFWDRLQPFVTVAAPYTRTYPITLTAVAGGAFTATVSGDMVSRVLLNYHTQVWLNTMTSPLEDTTWGSTSMAVRHAFQSQIAQSNLVEGNNQLSFVVMVPPWTSTDLYFDAFDVQYTRRFQADGDQILFPSAELGPRRYAIGNFVTDTLTIYDVTNPFAPQHIISSSITSAGGLFTTSFQISSTTPLTYFVAGADTIQSPKSIALYVPPDLSSASNGADYVIITHHDFITASQTLADYRASQGWRVKVIDVDDLYNEFNFGIYHPIAIKNFLHYAYDHWTPAPAYVVLVGDGHWNLKGFNPAYYGGSVPPITMPPNLSWVDPWQGEVDSANLLVAFTPPSHIPSMFIGRLLVDSVDDLNTLIGKIETYEQAGPQPYQRNVLFVTDNPDLAGDFVASSDGIISRDIPSNLIANRVYLPNYYPPPYNCSTSTLPCPAVNYAITATLNTTGALFLNYTGHGAQQNWAGESIFNNSNLPTLTNIHQLPIVLSLTCKDGDWTWPNRPSLIGETVRVSNGGAVAAFSPTGLGLTVGHDTLADGFYTAIFSNGVQHLGPATIAAKVALFNQGISLDLIDTFTIFGDPALRLPTYAISLSPVSASQVSLPGATAVYRLQVTNTAYLTDVLSLSAAGNTWPVTLSTTGLTLSPGGSAALAVSVTVPSGTLMGTTDHVTVTVASIGDSTRPTVQLTTTAGVVYGVNMTPLVLSQFGQAGQTLTYTLRLTNTGNISSTFALTAANYSWPTAISPALAGPLLAGAGLDVKVMVTIPLSGRASITDTAFITATAQGGSLPSATAQLITGVQYQVFLPLVLKQ